MINHPLQTADVAREFILAGNARFTIVSKRSGQRFTYRVRQPKGKPVHFVQLLRGPNNGNDYKFFGTIFQDERFVHSFKSGIGADAPSAKAFAWFWQQVRASKLPDSVECWHEGRCGRCGRALTVPSSVQRGIGPECVGYIAQMRLPMEEEHERELDRDFGLNEWGRA